MRVKVFIHPTGQWTTPFMNGLDHEMVEASDEMTLQETAETALAQANLSLDPTWIWLIEQPDEQGRQQMTSTAAVIDDHGVLRWVQEGVADVTVEELRRTHEAGLFKGDPAAICVERMLGANGVLPGWEDFFQWLTNAVGAGLVAAVVTKFSSILRRHSPRWQKRGAKSPYGFLDVVLARDRWNRSEVARLLQIKDQEAHDLLESLGFVLEGTDDSYRLSQDPRVGELRRRILKDFLHREDGHETGIERSD